MLFRSLVAGPLKRTDCSLVSDGAAALVLTDVVMPGLSGRELVDRLRQQRDVKVIFMSGYTGPAVFPHGQLEPRTHFLGKPFGPVALSRKVREILDRAA